MNDMLMVLERWHMDIKQVRERMYRAPTPRERERWHVIWLLASDWSVEQAARALERDERTIADWSAEFERLGPASLAFEQTGGAPPPSTQRNKRN
jgi:transposase